MVADLGAWRRTAAPAGPGLVRSLGAGGASVSAAATRWTWSGTHTSTPGGRCTPRSSEQQRVGPIGARPPASIVDFDNLEHLALRLRRTTPPRFAPGAAVRRTGPARSAGGRCRAGSTWWTNGAGTASSGRVLRRSTTWSCAAHWTSGGPAARTPSSSATVRARPSRSCRIAPRCAASTRRCSSSARWTTSRTPRRWSGSSGRCCPRSGARVPTARVPHRRSWHRTRPVGGGGVRGRPGRSGRGHRCRAPSRGRVDRADPCRRGDAAEGGRGAREPSAAGDDHGRVRGHRGDRRRRRAHRGRRRGVRRRLRPVAPRRWRTPACSRTRAPSCSSVATTGAGSRTRSPGWPATRFRAVRAPLLVSDGRTARRRARSGRTAGCRRWCGAGAPLR